ncbi:FtsX-like permease family protein [Leuconostoc sp.]|uniref:ABC transporter permease n=1 Tax=Leuconostoc sp. TaxID=1930076 RepID=UPI002579F0A4|nr:FtsX-like permease family protein [Leuconostoc sp.]NLT85486.1 ABC transporter permease [Leuconostoc sp.]
MFLALNEIRHEKMRYGLIVSVISLVSFLIFILSALSLGLANQNTAAIDSWKTTSALMTKNANGNMGQSLMTKNQLDSTSKYDDTAQVAISPTNVKRTNSSTSQSVQFIGVNFNEYIFKDLTVTMGHLPKNKSEIVISDKLNDLKIGDRVYIGLDNNSFKIVGKVSDAQYNMAPAIYGSINNWAVIKGVGNQFYGSGLISKEKLPTKNLSSNLVIYDKSTFLSKLPGYAAQNTTFAFMIVFLIIISLVVVTIFLYILTIQKLPNLAVLRAQGIPSKYLLKNTFGETLLIMITSVVLGLILTTISGILIPAGVPMYFNIPLIAGVGIGIVITGLIGSLIPMKIIAKIDPVSAIGG